MGIPDRRKNTYVELERKLDAHIDKIEAKFDRWFRRGLVIVALIGLCCAIALVGVYVVLGEIKDTREEFTRTQCEAQNNHNKNTSKALTVAAQHDIDNAKKNLPTSQGKVSAKEIENRRDVTLALIDALSPVQNCDYLVKLSVGDATPTPVPSPTQTPPTEAP